jgi:hypothetical protein
MVYNTHDYRVFGDSHLVFYWTLSVIWYSKNRFQKLNLFPSVGEGW